MIRTLTNITLLFLAQIGIFILSITLLPIQMVKRAIEGGFNTYIFNIAKNMDYSAGAIVDRTDKHTLSANSVYFNKQWRIKLIDSRFGKGHCQEAYEKEYGSKL